MKKLLTALLLLTMAAGSAQALEPREIVALAAMPLAVAAVSDVSGVPARDLVTVVSAMNRASVPAPQFVEIVRYTPVALVDTTIEPPFVTYVSTQADRGLYGDAYAVSLADRLRLYEGANEINVIQPVRYEPAYVVEREYIPSYVTTRMQPRTVDPLALIAMPLAVAAVSELAGIPRSDLFGLIASLNQAYVPAPQFVEIVRYAPVMLVERDPTFVRFVRTEVDRGIVGDRLVRLIDDRFDRAGFREVNFFEPEPVRLIDRSAFIPRVVVSRVVDAGRHPHGGAPGQLKKDLGLKTGSEIVHGSHPGGRTAGTSRSRGVSSDRVVVERDSKPGKSKGRVTSGRSRGDDDDKPKVKGAKKPKRSSQVEKMNRPARSGGQELRSSRGSGRSASLAGNRGGGKRGGDARSSSGKGSGKGKGKKD